MKSTTTMECINKKFEQVKKIDDEIQGLLEESRNAKEELKNMLINDIVETKTQIKVVREQRAANLSRENTNNIAVRQQNIMGVDQSDKLLVQGVEYPSYLESIGFQNNVWLSQPISEEIIPWNQIEGQGNSVTGGLTLESGETTCVALIPVTSDLTTPRVGDLTAVNPNMIIPAVRVTTNQTDGDNIESANRSDGLKDPSFNIEINLPTKHNEEESIEIVKRRKKKKSKKSKKDKDEDLVVKPFQLAKLMALNDKQESNKAEIYQKTQPRNPDGKFAKKVKSIEEIEADKERKREQKRNCYHRKQMKLRASKKQCDDSAK